MMEKLNRENLYSLEQYAEQRGEFRARVLEHKKHRRVDIGPNLTLYFEDRLTIQYQVQEMLRIERIFEADGIQEELDAYNLLYVAHTRAIKGLYIISRERNSGDARGAPQKYGDLYTLYLREKGEWIKILYAPVITAALTKMSMVIVIVDYT